MATDQNVLAENAAQLERIEKLAANRDALRRDLGGGWTVAVTLAHLAFWDRRVVRVLKQWESEGRRPDNVDDDLMNESLLDEWRALPPEVSARLAVEAGREVNRAVESLSEAIARQILEEGFERLLNRGLHRQEHLDGMSTG